MKWSRSRLLIFIFWFFANPGYSQFYESGQDPASIQWRQINTPHAQVIFPSDLDSAANRLAIIYDYIYWNAAKSLKASPRKISVVLHNHSTFSNGFVTLGPRRMELFTTPPQQNMPLDWMSDLAVHEFRHVAQISRINQGITLGLYPFFGQLSSGLVAAMMPLWFVEGDAVYTETMLTNSGRGRSGNFTMDMKPLMGEKDKLFSFEKTLYGSYKDFVPDHYRSGYIMVSAIRNKYGTGVFERSISHTAKYPFFPFSFSKHLTNETGKTSRSLYKMVFTEYKQQVRDSLQTRQSYPSFTNQNPKIYTSYRYPQPVNDTVLVAVKSGLGQIAEFIYVYKSGREETIYSPGIYNHTRFSYASGKIAWSEEIPDIRWSNRSYSCIKLYDTQTRSVKMLSRKSRYFAAALSRSAKQVATVEVTLENKIYLLVLDTQTGDILNRTLAPENLMLSDPVFCGDDNSILAIASGIQGKAIYSFNLTSSAWQPVTLFSYYDLSCPVNYGNYVLYSADYNGTCNLYAAHKTNKTICKLTNTKYGAFEPSPSVKDSVIYFSDYNVMGYTTKSLDFSKVKRTEVIFPKVYTDPVITSGMQAEQFNFQDSLQKHPSLLTRKYEVKKYSRLTHMFNVHSWSPFYYDYNNLSTDNQQVFPGVTVLSQDKLSTCVTSLSFLNQNSEWIFKPRFIYKGLFPVIDITADYGGAIPYARRFNKTAPSEYGYTEIKSLLYVPLNLSRGKYYSSVIPLLNVNYDNTRFFYTSDSTYRKGRTFAIFGFNAHLYLKTSERDFAPKFGFSIMARYKFAPFNAVHYGNIAYIKPRFYLPGILPHHSLQFSMAYQHQNPRTYLLSSLLLIARGYEYPVIDQRYPLDLYTFSADYAFPLCYPDLNIGPLAYFKRVRVNVFSDLAYNRFINQDTKQEVSKKYATLGVDWLTDFHLLHIFFPFSAGLRTVYLPDGQVVHNQFLLWIDFKF